MIKYNGMNTLAIQTDIRVKNVLIHEDAFSVELMDGRTLTTPLAWFPRLSLVPRIQPGNV